MVDATAPHSLTGPQKRGPDLLCLPACLPDCYTPSSHHGGDSALDQTLRKLTAGLTQLGKLSDEDRAAFVDAFRALRKSDQDIDSIKRGAVILQDCIRDGVSRRAARVAQRLQTCPIHAPTSEERRLWKEQPQSFWFPGSRVAPASGDWNSFVLQGIRNSERDAAQSNSKIRLHEYFLFREYSRRDPGFLYVQSRSLEEMRSSLGLMVDAKKLRFHICAGRRWDEMFVRPFGLASLALVPAALPNSDLLKVKDADVPLYVSHFDQIGMKAQVGAVAEDIRPALKWANAAYGVEVDVETDHHPSAAHDDIAHSCGGLEPLWNQPSTFDMNDVDFYTFLSTDLSQS